MKYLSGIRRFLKSRKAYIGLVASYTIILLISVLFASFGYRELYSARRAQIEQQYESQLNQAVYIANNYANSVRQSMMSVMLGAHSKSFVYTKYPMHTDDYYNLKQTIDEINGIEQAMEYNLALYVKGIDSVVSASTRLDTQAYYEITLKPTGLSADEFKSILNETGYFNVSRPFTQGSKRIALITASLPMASVSPTGTVCAVLDIDTLLSGFDSAKLTRDGILTVRIGDNLLSRAGKDINESADRLTFSSEGTFGINYTLEFGTDIVDSGLIPTQKFIIRMVLIELLGGLVFVLLLARTNYSPLKRLLEKVGAKSATGYESEYERILNAAGEWMTSNEELTGKLREQLPLVRTSMLRRMLMRSGSVSKDELIKFGIEFPHDSFAVLLIGTHTNQGSAETAAINYSIINLAEASSDDSSTITALQTGMSRVAVILNAHADAAAERARSFAAYISKMLHSVPLMGLSEVSDDFDALPQMYEQANEAYEYARAWHITELTEYSSLPAPGRHSLLSKIQENALFDTLESGDAPLACKLIRSALSDINGRPLSELRVTAYGILSVMRRVIENRRIPEDESPEMPKLNDVTEYLDELCRFAEATARLAADTKSAPDTDIGSRVMQILEERYADAALSLSDVADKLNLSASYLSHIFKLQTGMGFADALVNIRLDHAKQLLRETGLSVQAVAEQCGFTGAAYFSRVFKKQCGITPGQYRSE